MRKVVVLSGGIGPRWGRWEKLTGREGAALAAKEAIERAGIEPRQIQAIFVGNALAEAEKQGHIGPIIATELGIPEVPTMRIETACASGSSAFREAFVNVAAGIYDVVLVVGVEKVTHIDVITATTYFAYGMDQVYEARNGASFPGVYAAMAVAHMNKYGTTEEQMALVSVKNHTNALHNPKAHFHKKITVEDVLKSRVIAWPLKLYDCSPFSDGAAAVIVTTEEFARKYTDNLVYVIGSGRAGVQMALPERDDLTSIKATTLAAREAYRMAGIEPKDVDFAEVHDCFTIAEIIATEDLGFFKKGEGGKAVEEGLTQIDGKIAINPSGGLKAKGHPVGATGVGQVVEVWEQFNGLAGKRTVPGAEIALTHNVGATGGTVNVHIFRRG